MTLVIVKRDKDKISFSSDSRMTLSKGVFDSGIKIFTVPFRIRGPISSIEDRNKYDFECSYGLAMAGNSLNAYTVKESIAEVLANLQYPSNTADISIIGVGHMILRVYRDISEKLVTLSGQSGITELIIGGFCSIEKKIRVLRFFQNQIEDNAVYAFEEIMSKEDIYFSGSPKAKDLAKKIYSDDEKLTPLEIIKIAIESGDVQGIGGTPQYGYFDNENFRIMGTYEKIEDVDKRSIKTNYYLRGISFDQEPLKLEYPMLYVSYAYVPIVPPKPRHDNKENEKEI